MPFLKDSRFYHVKPTTISRMKKRLTNRVMQRCHSKGEPPTSTMALSPMRVPLEIPKSEVRYESGSDIDGPVMMVSTVQLSDSVADSDEE